MPLSVLARRLRPLLVLSLAGLFAGCTKDPAAAQKPTESVPVTVAAAAVRSVTVSDDALGTVTPLRQVLIKVRVDGQITAMTMAEGQEVAEGAPIAQLDPRPFVAVRRQQEALLDKDRALLKQAQNELKRYTELTRSNMASQDSLEIAQTQVATLTSSVAADQALLDAARLQEEFTTVKAPFQGVLGLRMVDPGAIVHVTDVSGLCTISQLTPISVICGVPQDQLPQVRALAGRVPAVDIPIRTRAGQPIAVGHIQAIDNHIDSATGEFQVRVVCANVDHALWPGAFVSARLPLATASGVAVPAAALLRSDAGAMVFISLSDQAHARLVVGGLSADGWTLIDHGLTAGELVVVAGQSRLEDGDQVTLQEASAPPAGASP